MSATKCFRAIRSLSAAVIIGQLAAVGTAAAQTDASTIVLKRDTAVQNAGTVSEVDVLSNDQLPAGTDIGAIEVIAQPQCGVVTAHPGRLTYRTFPECDGPQVFYYGIAGSPAFAEVTVLVQAASSAAEREPTLTFGMAVIERAPPADAVDDAPAVRSARSDRATITAPAVENPAVPTTTETTASLPNAPAPATQRTAELACAAVPAITIEGRPGALTKVVVAAPCLANSAAELHYGDISLGLALDAQGQGALLVPGFEPVMPATLALADGSKHDFELKFFGLSQIDRMAVVWDSPMAFKLNALEFGAERGTAGHLDPAGNPRSYDDVRRSGGGFLMTYEPVQGIGQNLQFYTHVAKPGGKAGVVRLVLDHERTGPGNQIVCGAASPSEILVLVSSKGELAQSARHTPTALGCAPSGLDRIKLGDLVGNVVIR